MKRLAAWLLAILMMLSAAHADIAWDTAPAAVQTHLQPYIARVNEVLADSNAGAVDTAYELYPAFASLGVDGVALPDDPLASITLPVQLQFSLSDAGLYSLTLRVSDLGRFAPVAAACLHASSPTGIPLEYARSVASAYAKIALDDVGSSITHAFEEQITDLQGNQPRAYFAYYPNQYGDGVTWMQLTLIFPLPGHEGGALVLNPDPASSGAYIDPEADPDFEGFLPAPEGSFEHYETFASPTPEPDSAAMERW